MLDRLYRLSIGLQFSDMSIRVDGNGVALDRPQAGDGGPAFSWQAWDSLNALIDSCRAEIDGRWGDGWEEDGAD